MSGGLKRVVVAAGLIRAPEGHPEAGKILMTRRLADAHLAGAWEFPGGKVEAGESPAEALHRELEEELKIKVEAPRAYAIGHHAYPEKEVILLIYDCRLASGEPVAEGVASFHWLSVAEVAALPLPPADEEALARLREELAATEGGAR